MQAATASGKDGYGLYEARRALCEAGADVVVVAPWDYQSGASGAVTNSGQVTVEAREELPAGFGGDCGDAPSGGPVYGLCLDAGACTPDSPGARPADTVKFALHGGLDHLVGWEDGPDLVVSGMNGGPNVSSSVNDSGTVGAAIAAIGSGVPAVALSAAGEGHAPASFETYRAGTDYAAALIGDLHQSGYLSSDYVVNVNVPHIADGGEPKGVVWTRVGVGTAALHQYTPDTAAGENTFTIGFGSCPGSEHCQQETREDADIDRLDGGYVTISALTGDRTLVGNEANELRGYVRSGRSER
ncbi:5'/3'-nucleotidase SurE [Zhihengliuella alba]|uniref:5'-nucleotidase n=2 Tax=Zhihengliuella alba TaxID=547018 RepID=A0ABP7DFC0_9MICC